MDDDYLQVVFLVVIVIMITLAIMTFKFTDKLEEMDRRISVLEKEVADLHSRTDAIQEETTTEEPTTETKREPVTATKEVRKEFKTEEPTTEAPEPKKKYIGSYELTAYVATGSPCADGVYPSEGWTVASNDPQLWHKRILIDGYGEYYVHDRGGMAVNVIDVFYGSDYDGAIQFGRRTADVYVIE